MSDQQITWGEWARVLKQMEQDQQREQQRAAQQAIMPMPAWVAECVENITTDARAIPGIDTGDLPACAHSFTSSGETWVTSGTKSATTIAIGSGGAGGMPDNAGYEGYGPMPTDAQGTVKSQQNTVISAVNGADTARSPDRGGYRSLMTALDRVHANWRSDGRPHRWEVE